MLQNNEQMNDKKTSATVALNFFELFYAAQIHWVTMKIQMTTLMTLVSEICLFNLVG